MSSIKERGVQKESEKPKSDSNASSSQPSEAVKAALSESSKKSAKSDERTNDSVIDPYKPKKDILKGFHGG